MGAVAGARRIRREVDLQLERTERELAIERQAEGIEPFQDIALRGGRARRIEPEDFVAPLRRDSLPPGADAGRAKGARRTKILRLPGKCRDRVRREPAFADAPALPRDVVRDRRGARPRPVQRFSRRRQSGTGPAVARRMSRAMRTAVSTPP